MAIAIDPVPPLVASLADLYALQGKESRSRELLDLIGDDPLDSRHIANIDADHDIRLEEAYSLARRDWSQRHDIFGADTLAWTALKTGRVEEARVAMADARRLGTRDARMLYHAGMIAVASGDQKEGRRLLRESLALNPRFDLLQARRAREALGQRPELNSRRDATRLKAARRATTSCPPCRCRPTPRRRSTRSRTRSTRT